MFNFDNAFELHNDIDVLKKMGLDCGLHSGTYTEDDVKTAKSMLPKALGNTLEGTCTLYHYMKLTFVCLCVFESGRSPEAIRPERKKLLYFLNC